MPAPRARTPWSPSSRGLGSRVQERKMLLPVSNNLLGFTMMHLCRLSGGVPSLCGGNGAALCILPRDKMPPTQQPFPVAGRASTNAVVYIGPGVPKTPGRKGSQPIAIEVPGRNLPKVYTPLSARGDLQGYVYLPPVPESQTAQLTLNQRLLSEPRASSCCSR